MPKIRYKPHHVTVHASRTKQVVCNCRRKMYDPDYARFRDCVCKEKRGELIVKAFEVDDLSIKGYLDDVYTTRA